MERMSDLQREQKSHTQELEAIHEMREKQKEIEHRLEEAKDVANDAAIEKQIKAALER